MKRIFVFISTSLFFIANLEAQEKKDSIVQLESITIKGFESNTAQRYVPSSISIITKKDFQKLSSFSLLPAFNMIAGVRMEERSPGSYRLSVRGSLLRSPFGVRNVKVYLNDFMLTDAGGNTYINLLDINNVGQAEIIKGPAGSLYGAGTGGAVLFSSSPAIDVAENNIRPAKLGISGGSFGTMNESFTYKHQSKNFSAILTQGHNQTDGYRAQSKMRKDYVQYQFKSSNGPKATSEGILLFSDLNYQTPGGLNAAQMKINPRQARPATIVLPSAVEQHAAVFNKTALIGFTNTFQLAEKWRTVTSFTTSFTAFKNPFITNYEKRNEVNVGIRTKMIYETKGAHPFQWVSGAELQRGNYKIDSSGNQKGKSDGNSVVDAISVKQIFVFSQLGLSPFKFMKLQGGFSLNSFNYELERIKGLPVNGKIPIKFNTQFLPRIAIMIDPIKSIGIFAQISKGYSAPSIAEVRPSAGGFYTGLQAEYGWNKEIGIKLNTWQNRLNWSISHFDFRLKDAIVRQTNSAGAEYFVNAGSTIQKGVESELSFLLINKSNKSGLNFLKLSQSFANNKFTFDQYSIGSVSFNGKKITGVPNQVVGLSIDASYLNGFYTYLNFYYTSEIPLNDANTVSASNYRLWQWKNGWKKVIKKYQLDFYALIDNLGNAKYSLGNDLNAFGSRYYNAAPGRNITIGCNFEF